MIRITGMKLLPAMLLAVSIMLPAAASALKMRIDVPATPIIPVPSMRNNPTREMDVTPLIACVICDSGFSPPFSAKFRRISVPGKSGLKVFKMRIGIFLRIAGSMVGG